MGHYAKRFFKGTNIRNGLRIEYLMNGNVLDTSGNSYNGTATSIGYGTDRKGNASSAAVFNASTDSISFVPTLFATNLAFTISCWVNVTSFPTDYSCIVQMKMPSGFPAVLYLGNSASFTGLGLGFSSATWARLHTNTPTSNFIGSWNMITITYNGLGSSSASNFNFYENGILMTKYTGGGVTGYTNANLIGKVYNNNANTFSGSMDAFRIWNRVLTESEITELYNE